MRTRDLVVTDKTCLCTHMRNFTCWTCGHNAYRLKDTTHRLADGSYQVLDAEHVFRDYQFSKDHRIELPPRVETEIGSGPTEPDAGTRHDSASLCLSDQPR